MDEDYPELSDIEMLMFLYHPLYNRSKSPCSMQELIFYYSYIMKYTYPYVIEKELKRALEEGLIKEVKDKKDNKTKVYLTGKYNMLLAKHGITDKSFFDRNFLIARKAEKKGHHELADRLRKKIQNVLWQPWIDAKIRDPPKKIVESSVSIEKKPYKKKASNSEVVLLKKIPRKKPTRVGK